MPAPTATDVNVPIGRGRRERWTPPASTRASCRSRPRRRPPPGPHCTDVKVPAGGVEMFPGQHASVWSVLSAQAKPPPTLTAVNVPAGGAPGWPPARWAPQHARVWSGAHGERPGARGAHGGERTRRRRRRDREIVPEEHEGLVRPDRTGRPIARAHGGEGPRWRHDRQRGRRRPRRQRARDGPAWRARTTRRAPADDSSPFFGLRRTSGNTGAGHDRAFAARRAGRPSCVRPRPVLPRPSGRRQRPQEGLCQPRSALVSGRTADEPGPTPAG